MKILPEASKVAFVKKHLALFIAILVGFVGLGLSPAFALDERVIDVVAVTWAGADAPAGDAKKVASVIDTEVNADWKSSRPWLVTQKIALFHLHLEKF